MSNTNGIFEYVHGDDSLVESFDSATHVILKDVLIHVKGGVYITPENIELVKLVDDLGVDITDKATINPFTTNCYNFFLSPITLNDYHFPFNFKVAGKPDGKFIVTYRIKDIPDSELSTTIHYKYTKIPNSFTAKPISFTDIKDGSGFLRISIETSLPVTFPEEQHPMGSILTGIGNDVRDAYPPIKFYRHDDKMVFADLPISLLYWDINTLNFVDWGINPVTFGVLKDISYELVRMGHRLNYNEGDVTVQYRFQLQEEDGSTDISADVVWEEEDEQLVHLYQNDRQLPEKVISAKLDNGILTVDFTARSLGKYDPKKLKVVGYVYLGANLIPVSFS